MTRITELSAIIEQRTKVVEDYLISKALPTPSFSVLGPTELGIENVEVEEARVEAIEASIELHDLLQGPKLSLRPTLNGTSLQAIYKWNIASHVPLDGSITFSDLSAKCGLEEADVRRVVRFAIAWHRVFDEPRKGHVAHSAASRLLFDDRSTLDGIGYQYDETLQAFARTVEARIKWGDSREPNHTGWSLAMGTSDTLYKYYNDHPECARRFASAMSLGSGGSAFEKSLLATSVPWADLKDAATGEPAQVVDVGGSKGYISVGIAKLAPALRFVVQDLPETIADARTAIPAEVKDRISLMPYNFFTEQPVKGADVYLFSHIFHNWSDEHVLMILRNQVSALKRGSRIVVSDAILPEPKTLGILKERQIRDMDMIMWSLFNARERERDDWVSLFERADSRFGAVDIRASPGSAWGVVEATWTGDEA